jgi:hypothetical protein
MSLVKALPLIGAEVGLFTDVRRGAADVSRKGGESSGLIKRVCGSQMGVVGGRSRGAEEHLSCCLL